MVFENAYTPTAKCAPSRAGIMTGRYPWQLEDAANHQPYFPAKFKSFTEAAIGAGMYGGAASKVWGPAWATTADGKLRAWGLAHTGRGPKAGPPEDLFDLTTDPDCVANLAADPAHRRRVAAMKEKLVAQLRIQQDHRALGNRDVFDGYPTYRKK